MSGVRKGRQRTAESGQQESRPRRNRCRRSRRCPLSAVRCLIHSHGLKKKSGTVPAMMASENANASAIALSAMKRMRG